MDQIRTISSIFYGTGTRTVKLSGGEPTLRNDLPEIISTVQATGMRSVIVTNGIRIRDDVFDAVVRHGAEFKFSIHRPDIRNDEVLRVRSFDRVRRNLASCRQRGVSFGLNAVVTAATVGLMADMVDFAIEHGARKVSFIPVVPRGRATTSDRDEIDPRGLADVRQRISELERVYRTSISVRCIDIRRRDYWVVENDGSLWIERASESQDTKVCDYTGLVARHEW